MLGCAAAQVEVEETAEPQRSRGCASLEACDLSQAWLAPHCSAEWKRRGLGPPKAYRLVSPECRHCDDGTAHSIRLLINLSALSLSCLVQVSYLSLYNNTLTGTVPNS